MSIPASLGRVAIFQPGRAGDFILTTPLFNAIKDSSPGTHLTAIVGPRSSDLARWHPAIDRTVVFDRSPPRLAAVLARLWSQRFDFWIDPKDHFSRSSTLIANLARARMKIGFTGGKPGPFSKDIAGLRVVGDHFIDRALAPLELVGVSRPSNPRISLGVSPAAERWADSQLPRTGRSNIFVNISAGSGSRTWPIGHWGELLARIAATYPAEFLLSSAPVDAALAARLVAEAGSRGVVIRQLPPSGLLFIAALVAKVDVVLTVDTSIVHIATAFEKPLLALYLSEFPAFNLFQPLTARKEVVAAEPGRSMATITVAQAEAAWHRLVDTLMTRLASPR